MDRNDLQHSKFLILLGGRLHLAPITEPHNILDLGTGSGIWAMDMADKHPEARVIGVDIASTQPQWVPPNCEFEIEDIENDWLWRPDSFDFIFGREILMAIRDWSKVIQQAYDHLKPGGYLELASTVAKVGCDDDTWNEEIAKDSAYNKIGLTFFELHQALEVDPAAPLKWKSQLTEAGFEDVEEYVFKIPTNPWPKDKRLKQIGAFEITQFRDGVANLFERGWTQVLMRDRAEFEIIMAKARQECMDRTRHTYVL